MLNSKSFDFFKWLLIKIQVKVTFEFGNKNTSCVRTHCTDVTTHSCATFYHMCLLPSVHMWLHQYTHFHVNLYRRFHELWCMIFFSPHFFLHFHMAIHTAYEQCVCLSWRANVTKYTAIPLRTTKNTQCMLTLHWWFQMNTKKIRQGKEVSTENIKLKHLSLQLLSMTCFPVI